MKNTPGLMKKYIISLVVIVKTGGPMQGSFLTGITLCFAHIVGMNQLV
tara:strand:+ start:1057 stop:1200 length:144 start_codon:yes stop_codon:yes gene_type:complete